MPITGLAVNMRMTRRPENITGSERVFVVSEYDIARPAAICWVCNIARTLIYDAAHDVMSPLGRDLC